MDDKGDHILVDDEYNITGIIDWTFARTVPAFEAFAPSLLTADMDDMFNGKAGRSSKDNIMAEELQSRDNGLGRIAKGPDLVRRLSFGLGMGMNLSWEEANALFQGVISTATGIHVNISWEVWCQNRLHQWTDDSRLKALLHRHMGTMAMREQSKAHKHTNRFDFQLARWLTVQGPEFVG